MKRPTRSLRGGGPVRPEDNQGRVVIQKPNKDGVLKRK